MDLVSATPSDGTKAVFRLGPHTSTPTKTNGIPTRTSSHKSLRSSIAGKVRRSFGSQRNSSEVDAETSPTPKVLSHRKSFFGLFDLGFGHYLKPADKSDGSQALVGVPSISSPERTGGSDEGMITLNTSDETIAECLAELFEDGDETHPKTRNSFGNIVMTLPEKPVRDYTQAESNQNLQQDPSAASAVEGAFPTSELPPYRRTEPADGSETMATFEDRINRELDGK